MFCPHFLLKAFESVHLSIYGSIYIEIIANGYSTVTVNQIFLTAVIRGGQGKKMYHDWHMRNQCQMSASTNECSFFSGNQLWLHLEPAGTFLVLPEGKDSHAAHGVASQEGLAHPSRGAWMLSSAGQTPSADLGPATAAALPPPHFTGL